MSIDDYRVGRGLMAQDDDADVVGERPERLVELAEQALGVRFPPSYRAFVRELGAGDAGGEEFYGVIDDDFESSAVPDGVWLTLRHRETSGLPDHLVTVATTGDGSYYVVDASGDGRFEGPVVIWTPGLSSADDDLERVADSFGEFFRRILEQSVGG